MDTKPLYDLPCDDFGDLEELDRGECPWDFTLSTDDKDDLTRYVLTRFLWNQLEGEIDDWENEFPRGSLPYLNNETLRLMRWVSFHPNQCEDEETFYPGLEEETISHWCSLLGVVHNPN